MGPTTVWQWIFLLLASATAGAVLWQFLRQSLKKRDHQWPAGLPAAAGAGLALALFIGGQFLYPSYREFPDKALYGPIVAILLGLLAFAVARMVFSKAAQRVIPILAGVLTTAIILIIGQRYGLPLMTDLIDQSLDWLINKAGDELSAFNDVVVGYLGRMERFLHETLPWVLIVILFGAAAYHASRKLSLACAVMIAMVFIGSLGLWKQAMQTMSLIIVAILVTILIGLPLGVLMARHNRLRAIMLPVLDLMQTMPSFVYLIPAVMLFGLGTFSAVLATVIYAAPPLMRLTDLGIRMVDTEVMEAATAFGADRRQKLWGVQIHLALPNIMAGVNQSIMMALAMVVIASMIGVRGLGQEVLQGLQRQEAGIGFAAGISIVLLAIVLDRITQAYGRRMEAHRQGA